MWGVPAAMYVLCTGGGAPATFAAPRIAFICSSSLVNSPATLEKTERAASVIPSEIGDERRGERSETSVLSKAASAGGL